MRTPVKTAAAVAAGALLLARAAAQTAVPPAVPPTPPPPDASAPEVQYDTYVEPFDDNPVNRLRNIVPLPPPTPLFEDYDPLKGLDRRAQTSRVTRVTRACFALGTRTVHVGDTFTIPFIQHAGPTVSAYLLKVEFDPSVIQAVDASAAQWKSANVDFNASPDHITPEKRFIVLAYGTGNFWTGEGVLATIRVKAVGTGTSDIATYHFDAADDSFNTMASLVRDGFVRVLP